jgi:hypothetical protein
MNLEMITQIGGSLSVVISIVGLIATMRQQNKFQRALVVDSLSAALTDLNIPSTESPDLGIALSIALVDWRAATKEQRVIAHFFLFSFFKLLENAWYQQRSGVLEPEQWIGWDTLMRKYFHAPGVQNTWWPVRRHAYSPLFQAYLEQTRAPTGLGNLTDLFDLE